MSAPRETETGAPPEPSAWMTPSRGSTGWGFSLTPRRQDDTSVPLYTLDAAREGYVRESEVVRLRIALAKIAAQVDDTWDDHCGHMRGDGKPDRGHEPTCPYDIARNALAKEST